MYQGSPGAWDFKKNFAQVAEIGQLLEVILGIPLEVYSQMELTQVL